jgi:ubiquitin thioesterase protein OTUB1
VGPQSEASSLILRRFNDKESFSAIIYYFRLVASELLRANSVTEKAFNPDGIGVSICKDMLEPLNAEVENLGVTILIDILMNPMSIAVEIAYPDRPVN